MGGIDGGGGGEGPGGFETVRAPGNQWLWDDHVSRYGSCWIFELCHISCVDGKKHGCKLVGSRDRMMLPRCLARTASAVNVCSPNFQPKRNDCRVGNDCPRYSNTSLNRTHNKRNDCCEMLLPTPSYTTLSHLERRQA